jgi:hypothetical protein
MKLENISLQDIFDYIDSGSPASAPDEIVRYLDLLDKARGMHLRSKRYGTKDSIIKHLMKVEDLSRYLANQIYNDALEYFYSDQQISNAAWRNILAEKMYNNYLLAIAVAKDTKDVRQANAILVDVYKARGLDQPDKEEIPEELFNKPWKLYAMDAEMLNLPPVNRVEIGKLIDELPDLTEKEKIMIKREAVVLPIKLFPDEQEDARKS